MDMSNLRLQLLPGGSLSVSLGRVSIDGAPRPSEEAAIQRRIVDCVNACAGVADIPAEGFAGALRSAAQQGVTSPRAADLERAVDAMRARCAELSHALAEIAQIASRGLGRPEVPAPEGPEVVIGGNVYWLDDGALCSCAVNADGSFDRDGWWEVDLGACPNHAEIIALLIACAPKCHA